MALEKLSIDAGGARASAALHLPSGEPRAAIALAHGAGTDMDHPSLVAIAEALAARGHAVMRFNFPYKELGKKAPDPAAKLEAAWRAAAEVLRARVAAPLFIGGRSMGGRMASHIAAQGFACAGLVFLGYPLHPAGHPEKLRDAHLGEVTAPMLFVQGTRDALCDLALLRPVLERLGDRAALHVVEGGDHGFELLKSAGRTQASVTDEIGVAVDAWIRARLEGPARPRNRASARGSGSRRARPRTP